MAAIGLFQPMPRPRYFHVVLLTLLLLGLGRWVFQATPFPMDGGSDRQRGSGPPVIELTKQLPPGAVTSSGQKKGTREVPPATPAVTLLEGAELLDTRQKELADGTLLIAKLYRQSQFKYPLIRVVDTRDREGATQRQMMVGDHVLMKFPPSMDETAVAKWAATQGWRVRRHLTVDNLFLIATDAANATAVDDLIAAHAKAFPTSDNDAATQADLFAEPDYLQFACVTPNDPSLAELWGLNNVGQDNGLVDADINAPEAWDTVTGKETVLVGVIDSGIDIAHPDLAKNIAINPGEIPGNRIDDDKNGFVDDVYGWDFYSHDSTPEDGNSHGTHVAGTIGAVGDNEIGITGVAWRVGLVPIRFLGPGGSGATSDAVEAVAYATKRQVTLTNNSWGGGGYSQALKNVMEAANAAGILFVAAAGNASANADIGSISLASYRTENLVVVASTTRTDTLSSFSNFGPSSVHLAAPGSDIYSTLPDRRYGIKSGTSMAAPHVSGALAVMKSLAPNMRGGQLKKALLASVAPLPALKDLCVTGGRLDLQRAVQAVKDFGAEIGPVVVDDSEGGNGDGVVNPGEEFRLRFTVTNDLNETISQVHVAVSVPDDSNFTVMKESEPLGDLAGGAQISSTAITLRAADSVLTPDPDSVTLTLTSEAPTVTAVRHLILQVRQSTTISGLTMDGITQKPAAGVTVEFEGEQSGSVATDTEGRYAIVVPNGAYRLTAYGGGYAKAAIQDVTTPPNRLNVDFVMGQPGLSVTPAALTAMIPSGEAETEYLTVRNTGLAPLEWRLNAAENALSQSQAAGGTPMVAGLLSENASYYEPALISLMNDLGGSARFLQFPLTTSKLSPLTVLIIDDSMRKASAADIALVRQAVQNGMGLIVTTVQSYDTIKLNQVLKGSGMTISSGSAGDSSSFGYPLNNILPHPLTWGVTALKVGSSSCGFSGTDPAMILATNSYNNGMCAATRLGRGRIMGLPSGFVGDKWLPVADNRRLVSNALQWVALQDRDWMALPITAGTLAPGAETQVPVKLDASYRLPGLYESELQVTSNAPVQGSVSVPVSLTILEGGTLVVKADTVDFGTLQVGATASRQVVLTNPGCKPVTLLGGGVPGSPHFALTQKLPLIVAAGESVTVAVEFAPRAAGSFSDTLEWYYSGGQRRVLTVPVTAAAFLPGTFAVEPTAMGVSLYYGEQRILPFTIRNTSDQALSYTVSTYDYFVKSTIVLNKTQGYLQPGASETLKATLTPVSDPPSRPSTYGESITVHADFGNGPYAYFNVPVSVTARYGALAVITPAALDFGDLAVGRTIARTVKIRNPGSSQLTIQSVTLPSASWSISRPFPVKVAANGGEVLLPISFTPAAAGVLDGDISLQTNAGTGAVQTIAVQGRGLEPPGISVTPPSLAFSGTIEDLQPAKEQVLEITNSGATELEWHAWLLAPEVPPLDTVVSRVNAATDILTAAVPQRYDFPGGETGQYISAPPFASISGNLLSTSPRYATETQPPLPLPYSNNSITWNSWLGPEGQYFTRKLPGLFVFGADLDGTSSFGLVGKLAPDVQKGISTLTFSTSVGERNYTVFGMRMAGQPRPSYYSCNHLFFLETKAGQTHAPNYNQSDYSYDHRIYGMSGRTRMYGLMFCCKDDYPPTDAEMKNLAQTFLAALHGTSAPWLTVTPDSGRTAPAETAEVRAVTTMSSSLPTGAHEARIFFTHNGPGVLVSVPVSLQHVSAPNFVFDESLAFAETPVGASTTGHLMIGNKGTEPLQVTGLASSDPAFTFSPSGPVTLGIEQTVDLAVTFSPTEARAHSGTITFTTTDPARSVVTASLSGVGAPAPVLSVTPVAPTLDVPAKTSASTSFTITNTGGHVMNWTAAVQPLPGYLPPEDFPEPTLQPLSLSNVRASVGYHAALLPEALANRYDFTGGTSGSSIADGGAGMFETGNQISTNLNNGAFVPYSDNANAYSASLGSYYFTRKLPGLFIFAADLYGVTEFRISGKLGSDPDRVVSATTLSATVYGHTYTGFVKRVHGAGSRPSVNHLIIVESAPGQGHDFPSSAGDDGHRVYGLSGYASFTRLYYLMFAGSEGSVMDDAATLNLMRQFLLALSPDLSTALSLSSTSGSTGVSPDSDMTSLSVNASNLPAGTYRAAVDFTNTSTGAVIRREVPVRVYSSPLLSVTKKRFDFYPANSGEKKTLGFQVRNIGSMPLVITAPSVPNPAFQVLANLFPRTLEPNASNDFTVVFQPNTAGIYDGDIVFKSNDPITPELHMPVTALCQPMPVLICDNTYLPATVSYQAPYQWLLKVTNTGAAPVTWKFSEADLVLMTGFTSSYTKLTPSISGDQALDPGASTTFAIKIPQTLLAGNYTATIKFLNVVDGNVLTSVPVSLKINSAPGMTLTAEDWPGTKLDFGSLYVPATKTLKASVFNGGSDPLTITAVNVPPGFTTIPAAPFTLAVSERRQVSVIFTPTTNQSVTNGTLQVVTSHPALPAYSLPIAAEGKLPATLSVDTTPLHFDLGAGQTTAKPLVIQNSGGLPGEWTAAVTYAGPLGAGWELQADLQRCLSAIDAHAAELAALIPQRYDFDGGSQGDFISDGGDNMYDGGNIISWGGKRLQYSDGNVTWVTPYSVYNRQPYFTRRLPGLFVLGAEVNDVASLNISGDLGADGAGKCETAILSTSCRGVPYRGFLKRVYGAASPSVNHLFVVRNSTNAAHTFDTGTNSDAHAITNLKRGDRLYYLLYAGKNGARIDDAAALNLMNAFLAILPPDDSEWLSVAPGSGAVPAFGSQEVSVLANAARFSAGTYNATINIYPGGTAAPFAVPVTVNVAAPDLSLAAPDGKEFVTVLGANPAPVSLMVTTADDDDWSVTSDADWLVAPTAPNKGTKTVQLSFSAPQLAEGTHVARVQASTASARRSVMIVLNVEKPNINRLIPDPHRPVVYALHQSKDQSVILAGDAVSGEFRDSYQVPKSSVMDLDTAGEHLYLAGKYWLVQAALPMMETSIHDVDYQDPADIAAHDARQICVLNQWSHYVTVYDFTYQTKHLFPFASVDSLSRITFSADGTTLWANGRNDAQRLLKIRVNYLGLTQIGNVPVGTATGDPVPTLDGKTVFLGTDRRNAASPTAAPVLMARQVIAALHDGSIAVSSACVLDGTTGNVRENLPAPPTDIAAFSADESRLLRFTPGDTRISVINSAEISVAYGDGADAIPMQDGIPGTADFGSALVSGSVSRKLILRNDGWTYLNHLVVTADASPGTVVALQALPDSRLAPGQAMSLTVTMNAATAGAVHATLHVASSDADEPMIDIPVTGRLTENGEAPVVVTQPEGQVLERGEPLHLSASVIGTDPLSCQWLLNDKPISKATGLTYRVDKTTPAHAGAYTLRVTNPNGQTLSAKAVVGIYEEVPNRELIVNEGQPFKLTSKVTGAGLKFWWFRDDALLTSPPGITGAQEPSLRAPKAAAGMSGSYRLEVSAGAQRRLVARYTVGVRQTPVIQPQIIPPLPVGGLVDLILETTHLPTAFAAKGLPPGLKLDTSSGRLTGRPTKAGDYLVRFTASNAAGAGPECAASVTVVALPDDFIGPFEGLITTGTAEPFKAGRISLDVQRSGAFTGVIACPALRLSLTGFLQWQAGSPNAYIQYKCRSTGAKPKDYTFVLELHENGVGSGLMTANNDQRKITVTRCYWPKDQAKPAYAGRHNILLDLPDSLIDHPPYPQGNGYFQLLISASGGATMTGKLADGTAATLSTRIGNRGTLPMVVADSKPISTGYGWLSFSTLTLTGDGTLRWARSSGDGKIMAMRAFGAHDQQMHSERYTPPEPGQLVLDLPDTADNAVFVLHDTYSNFQPQPVQIGLTSAMKFPSLNPARLTGSLNTTTGLFSGSLYYGGRKTSMSGLLFPTLQLGAGTFFLPTGSTATAEIRSGQILLLPR